MASASYASRRQNIVVIWLKRMTRMRLVEELPTMRIAYVGPKHCEQALQAFVGPGALWRQRISALRRKTQIASSEDL